MAKASNGMVAAVLTLLACVAVAGVLIVAVRRDDAREQRKLIEELDEELRQAWPFPEPDHTHARRWLDPKRGVVEWGAW